MAEKVGQIYFDVTLDTSKLIDGARQVDREVNGISNKFSKMAAAITAALSAIAIEGLVSKIITAQRQFDVMFASLKTVTGGATQASAAFERLEQFAAKTPYSLDQAVQGFVKLKALGLDPSERAMTSFGNTASAMGKDLNQMIEAVADASTGEFERLKEFGIKARTEGDQVKLTFQGVTTTVQNNAAAITEYLTRIGEVEFAGAMSERMKTLDGDISNLQDSLAKLYLTISQSGFGDAVAAGVRAATGAIAEMTTSIKEGGLTEYFDRLRPYIAAAELAVVSLAGAITGRLIAAFAASATQAYAAATAMGAATIAARGFGAILTALGGPIGIAVTGIALLALKWGEVGGQARDAASISEDAARRIASALNKSAGRAGEDLKKQLAEVQDEIAGIDAELGRKSFPLASKEDLAELRERRDVLVKVANDVRAAMDKLHGGAGRGKITPELVNPDAAPPPAPPAPSKSKGAKFDAEGYLAGLRGDVASPMEQINIREEEALRRNRQLLDEGRLSRQQYADAITLIELRAQEERRAVQLRGAEETRQLIEQQGIAELAAQKRLDDEKKRARESARELIVGDDPIARLQMRLEAESALLAGYAALDFENLQLYAAAKLALEQQTNEAIAAESAKRRATEAAGQSQQLQAYSAMFGGIADVTKTFAGKQSGIYKAMFAASKAFAIADAVIKIQQGVANAAALPFPANLAAIGSVVAATSSIVSTISGTQYGGGRQYGGPVSAGSLYRVNETGRPEMFTASNGSQYMMPTANGSVTPADKVGGGLQVNVQVINRHPTAQVTQRTGESGQVQLFVSEVARQFRENDGPIWEAARSSTNIASRL